MPSSLLALSLGSLILNLKIRFHHWIIIGLITSAVNVGLEQWLGSSLIKVIVPVFIMIGLFSCLLKTNLHKSAIAVIMGYTVYAFIESIALLISYNLFQIYFEEYLGGILVNIIIILFMVLLGLGIIALIKKFHWQLYNLGQIADDSRENRPILTALLFLVGIPFLIYCLILWLMTYLAGLMAYLAELTEGNIEHIIADISKIIANVVLILNISNAVFLVYFFATCFAMKRFDNTLAKTYKYRADRSVMSLLRQFFAIKFEAKEAYVKQKTPADTIPIPQLNLFFHIQYALARERQVDFVLQASDLSGLEAYVDDAFIRMLERLFENAFEAVEPAEFKEIYCEIAKDDDGGFTLIIKNNGDVLPKGGQKQPFELGYTTKNAPDRGYGLYAVKKLLDHYQGSIDLRGSDGYTQVTIKLPFKETYMPAGPEQPKKPLLRIVKSD